MRNRIGKRAASIAWPILVTVLLLLAWEISVQSAMTSCWRICGLRFISQCSGLDFPSSAALSSRS